MVKNKVAAFFVFWVWGRSGMDYSEVGFWFIGLGENVGGYGGNEIF